MAIDFDNFYQWCCERFGEQNLKVRHTAHGVEICMNSLWSLDEIGKEDRKYKLWMSCHGGKKKVEHGVYRCWLTDHSGTLVEFVSDQDGIPYDEAEELIADIPSLRALEMKVDQLFEFKGETEIPTVAPQSDIEFPDHCYRIKDMSPDDPWCIRATDYLHGRKLPIDEYYVTNGQCEKEDWRCRIVIPYYDRDGKLMFYNGRHMDDKNPMRYRKLEDVDLEEVLYMTKWPREGSKVYLMEGEFDAKSIELAGLVGAACGGKSLSSSQMELLRGYQIVLAFDADDAGLKAVLEIGDELLSLGFPVKYVRPPKVFKDWNKLLVERDAQTLRQYLERFERPYSRDTSLLIRSKLL